MHLYSQRINHLRTNDHNLNRVGCVSAPTYLDRTAGAETESTGNNSDRSDNSLINWSIQGSPEVRRRVVVKRAQGRSGSKSGTRENRAGPIRKGDATREISVEMFRDEARQVEGDRVAMLGFELA